MPFEGEVALGSRLVIKDSKRTGLVLPMQGLVQGIFRREVGSLISDLGRVPPKSVCPAYACLLLSATTCALPWPQHALASLPASPSDVGSGKVSSAGSIPYFLSTT
jgi:hypothetical protein